MRVMQLNGNVCVINKLHIRQQKHCFLMFTAAKLRWSERVRKPSLTSQWTRTVQRVPLILIMVLKTLFVPSSWQTPG